MLRSEGKRKEKREETARRTAAENWSSGASKRRCGCCDRCEQETRGGEAKQREKERYNDRTARLSPLKQFVSAVHRNWSGNTAATVSNTLRPCVLSHVPLSLFLSLFCFDPSFYRFYLLPIGNHRHPPPRTSPLFHPDLCGHLWYLLVEDPDDYESRDDLPGSWPSMGFHDYKGSKSELLVVERESESSQRFPDFIRKKNMPFIAQIFSLSLYNFDDC